MSKPPGSRLITRQSDGAGYSFNDSRSTHAGVQEYDVVCCPHCQCTMNLQMWRKEREQGGGGWCRQCSAPVCGPCLTRMLTFGCEPFMQKVDKALEQHYRIEQNRKAL